jgi:hypothetical protein
MDGEDYVRSKVFAMLMLEDSLIESYTPMDLLCLSRVNRALHRKVHQKVTNFGIERNLIKVFRQSPVFDKIADLDTFLKDLLQHFSIFGSTLLCCLFTPLGRERLIFTPDILYLVCFKQRVHSKHKRLNKCVPELNDFLSKYQFPQFTTKTSKAYSNLNMFCLFHTNAWSVDIALYLSKESKKMATKQFISNSVIPIKQIVFGSEGLYIGNLDGMFGEQVADLNKCLVSASAPYVIKNLRKFAVRAMQPVAFVFKACDAELAREVFVSIKVRQNQLELQGDRLKCSFPF